MMVTGASNAAIATAESAPTVPRTSTTAQTIIGNPATAASMRLQGSRPFSATSAAQTATVMVIRLLTMNRPVAISAALCKPGIGV